MVDFATIRFNNNNDLPYMLFLPSYTATAWYHKALPADLQAQSLTDLLKQAEEFALGPYASGLLQGAAIDATTRASLVEQYARLTGLSKEYVTTY